MLQKRLVTQRKIFPQKFSDLQQTGVLQTLLHPALDFFVGAFRIQSYSVPLYFIKNRIDQFFRRNPDEIRLFWGNRRIHLHQFIQTAHGLHIVPHADREQDLLFQRSDSLCSIRSFVGRIAMRFLPADDQRLVDGRQSAPDFQRLLVGILQLLPGVVHAADNTDDADSVISGHTFLKVLHAAFDRKEKCPPLFRTAKQRQNNPVARHIQALRPNFLRKTACAEQCDQFINVFLLLRVPSFGPHIKGQL